MKTLLITTAAALTLSTGAFAQSEQLRLSVADELDTHNFNVDVDTLTDEQVAEIYAITQSDDDMGERTKIMSVLGDSGYQSMELGEEMIFVKDMANAAGEAMPEGGNSLRDQVGIKLAEFGYDDVNTEELTDDQVAKIFAVVQNSDQDATRGKIETILQ